MKALQDILFYLFIFDNTVKVHKKHKKKKNDAEEIKSEHWKMSVSGHVLVWKKIKMWNVIMTKRKVNMQIIIILLNYYNNLILIKTHKDCNLLYLW